MTNIKIEDNSRYETYVYFYIYGFKGETSEITRKLKLEPTRTWHKDDVELHSQSPKKFSSWEIHSPLDRSEIFLDAHIEAVLNIIEPKQPEILELQKQGCDIGINCVGYYTDANPGFHLSAKLLFRMAKFSFDVDFDLYCSCSDSNEE